MVRSTFSIHISALLYFIKSYDAHFSRDFSDDTMWLFSGPTLSRYLASKGCKGRAKVVTAFLKYFKKGGHQFGFDLVKARLKVMERELAQSDIAALKCVNG